MNEPCYYRVSVKGIVVDDDGRILLSREDDGWWDMLGGGLHHGEDPIEGLRREIREETGLEVTYVSPSPKYFVTGPRRSRPDIFIANPIYEIKLADMNIVPSDECQELRFFTPEEMSEVNLMPTVDNFRKLLINQNL